MTLVSIGKMADYFGVSTQTVRNWEAEGMFTVKRTKGGHRRFLFDDFFEKEDETKKTAIYNQVSSDDQKSDSKKQSKD